MGRKIFVVSDTHFGLSAAGYDRTTETDDALWAVVEQAINDRASLFIHCGDIGHRNHPKPEIYARWVKIWERLNKQEIKTRFLIGNHDIIHDVEQPMGSLSPLRELNYPSVEVVAAPRVEKLQDGWVLVYLPYLSRSHVGSNPQEFIEDWLRQELGKIEAKGDKAIVFAHWNIEGVDIGGDRIMRPSRLVFPGWVCDHPAVGLAVSGHIHLHQVLKNHKAPHVCIGSAIYTDFGDGGEKVYLTMEIRGDGVYLDKHPTLAVRLVELNYDLVGYDIKLLKFDRKQVEGCIVKVTVRCTEGQRESVDWEAFRVSIAEHAQYVRPIRPVIVREEAHQPVVLKAGQTDEQMVLEWIRERRPPEADLVAECANEALEKA